MTGQIMSLPQSHLESAQVFLPHLLRTVTLATSAINPPKLEIQLYITDGNTAKELDNPLPYCKVIPGRPDLKSVIARIDDQHASSSIMTQTCGPVDFMREVSNFSNHRGWRVRQETFEL